MIEPVRDLQRGSRSTHSHSATEISKAAKSGIYGKLEGLARSGAAIVELSFGSLPPHCTRLSLQASARPSPDGVRISLLTLCIRVIEQDLGRIGAIAGAALREFGGTRFTGLEAARSGLGGRKRAAEGLDASVVFPSDLPFLAQNVVFIPRLRTIDETLSFARVLTALGVQHEREGGMLRVAHRQWRMPMRVESQLRAFETAIFAGFGSAVYSAPLPVLRSTRLELRSPARRELECILTGGLASEAGCGPDDLRRMENFVAEQFGIGLSALNSRPSVTRAFSPHDRSWRASIGRGLRARRG